MNTEELFESFDKSAEIEKKLSESIIKLINESGINDVNFGLGLGKTLGRVLSEFDYRYDSDDNRINGLGNLSDSIIKNHRKSVINDEIPNIKMLYDFLVEYKHSEDNMYDIGYGDRYMCYIEKSPNDDLDVIYYENQNIKFLVCIENGSSFLGKSLHIRRVYDNIMGTENESYYRTELKKDNGLEFALDKLTHNDEDKYSNNVEGSMYPDKFTLEDVKLGGFKRGFTNSKVLQFKDSRDKGYLLSCSYSDLDVSFTNDTKYVWDELLNGVYEIPDSFKIVYNRERELEKLGE